MDTIRGLTLLVAILASAMATIVTAQAYSENAAHDWQNGNIEISKVRDHSWNDGDQYRYGNNPCSYVDGYKWNTISDGWKSRKVKTRINQCAVEGSSYFAGYKSIMTFDSTYWQQLDYRGYANVNEFHNPNNAGLAVVTYAYQNYSGGASTLYYSDNILSTFGDISQDKDGNIVRKINKPFDKTLKYPDGNSLRLTSVSGITYSSNGRWMYLNVDKVGQLRLDTENFSAFSFATGFYPSSVVYTAISNSGDHVAVYSASKGLKVYDLMKCEPEKPNYASRNCHSRDLMKSVEEWLAGHSPEPSKLKDISVLELKFTSDYDLRALIRYRYGTDLKAAIINIKLTTEEPPMRYLALGDSFSSGEGTFSYTEETNYFINEDEYNICHTSPVSYPYLLNQAISSPWFGSIACSGSVTSEVVSNISDKDYINKLSQARMLIDVHRGTQPYIDKIKNNILPGYIPQNSIIKKYLPNVVTVTMGGNDIGFGDIITACITQPGCFSQRDDREAKADEIALKILGMTSKLRAIRESMGGTDAKLFVLGYPKITNPNNSSCSLIGQAERERADAMVEYLNESIKIAAHNAGAAYIDLSNVFINFETGDDHRICGNANRAVNGLILKIFSEARGSTGKPGGIHASESYHPNILGHRLLAAEIYRLTNGLYLRPVITSTKQVRPDESFYKRFVGDSDDRLNLNSTYKLMVKYEAVKRGETVGLYLPKTSDLLPSADGKAKIEIHSDPTELAVVEFNPLLDSNFTIRIPELTLAGWHDLHIKYVDMEGKMIDLYQKLYVIGSEDDYDGDGVLNKEEACPIGGTLGVDEDKDGIDDACDPTLKVGQTANSHDDIHSTISTPVAKILAPEHENSSNIIDKKVGAGNEVVVKPRAGQAFSSDPNNDITNVNASTLETAWITSVFIVAATGIISLLGIKLFRYLHR